MEYLVHRRDPDMSTGAGEALSTSRRGSADRSGGLAGASSAHLVSVQLLRAIAAITVVFGHAETEAVQVLPGFAPVGFNFGIGVDIFFIISGFVMYLSSAHLFGREGAPLTFARRRFLRVVPLYWFYTIGMLAAIALFPSKLNNADVTVGMVISSFLFYPLPNTQGNYSPVLALGWTLNYEMFFYALFAFSLMFDKVRGFRVLSGLILGFVLVGLVVREGPLVFWGQPIILEFLLGVLLARVFAACGPAPGRYGFLAAMAAAALSYVLLSGYETRAISLGIPSGFFAAGFIFCLPARLNRVLDGLARVGGDSSYSLYLSHPFTLAIVKILWLRLDPGFDMPWSYVVVSTLASVIVAYGLYLGIERPLLRVWRRSPQ